MKYIIAVTHRESLREVLNRKFDTQEEASEQLRIIQTVWNIELYQIAYGVEVTKRYWRLGFSKTPEQIFDLLTLDAQKEPE